VIPVGNLGNISALYKGFQLMMDLGLINSHAEAGRGPSGQGQSIL
jgi:threonine synthase